MSNLTFPWCSLRPFPFVLLPGRSIQAPSCYNHLVREFKSPLSLLFSLLNTHRSSAAPDMLYYPQPFTSFVALSFLERKKQHKSHWSFTGRSPLSGSTCLTARIQDRSPLPHLEYLCSVSLNSIKLNIKGFIFILRATHCLLASTCFMWSKHQTPKYFSLCFVITGSRWMCFLPGCHKLTFMVWWITLAPFSLVALTLHNPGHMSCFLAS